MRFVLLAIFIGGIFLLAGCGYLRRFNAIDAGGFQSFDNWHVTPLLTDDGIYNNLKNRYTASIWVSLVSETSPFVDRQSQFEEARILDVRVVVEGKEFKYVNTDTSFIKPTENKECVFEAPHSTKQDVLTLPEIPKKIKTASIDANVDLRSIKTGEVISKVLHFEMIRRDQFQFWVPMT